jgi:formylglycine-generating enzyme required for sulfatase activity
MRAFVPPAVWPLVLVLACIADVPLESAGDRKPAEPMIRIPAGPFVMGSEDGPEDERPRHRVDLPAFNIDRTPVTNRQFAEFLNTTGLQAAQGEKYYDVDDNDARIHLRGDKRAADIGFENHPVVEASWYGALAYCRWLDKRLPTEAEWEKAARGTDARKYPWGNEPPDSSRAQFNGGWHDTRPVGSFPRGASPYGALDMAGNVWEWVSSAYLPYPYNAKDGREDLTREHVRGTRGGGQDSPPDELSTTHRGRHVSRNFRSGHHNIGFRCAQ